jgi:hypothetical protein
MRWRTVCDSGGMAAILGKNGVNSKLNGFRDFGRMKPRCLSRVWTKWPTWH